MGGRAESLACGRLETADAMWVGLVTVQGVRRFEHLWARVGSLQVGV